jgi:mRNA interferase RelE/StbE
LKRLKRARLGNISLLRDDMESSGYPTTLDRAAKKLHARDKKTLDGAIRKVIASPGIGVAKKGNLAGVFVHKLKFNKQEVLLSYQVSPSELVL